MRNLDLGLPDIDAHVAQFSRQRLKAISPIR
jgi:hypothetical protein